jgi:hypothetical protein
VILLILGGLNYYFSQSPQGKSTLIFTKPAYLYMFWIVPITYLAYYRNQRIKETLKKQYGSPLYNKETSKPHRKMGHITVLGATIEEVKEKATFVQNNIGMIAL